MPVYEQSYRHLGQLKKAGRAPFVPIAETGIRLFFRNKKLLLLALAALVPFFLFFLAILAPHMLLSGRAQNLLDGLAEIELLGFNGTSAYFFLIWGEWLFVLVFTVLAGGGLVANDMRTNALEVYLSRPLERWQYFLGKLSVVCGVLLMVTLAPCLVLWLTDLTMNRGEGQVARLFALLPRVVLACLVLTVPYGLLVLAVSSLARSTRIAMAVLAGLVILSSVAARTLEEIFANPWFGLFSPWISMTRLAQDLLRPNAELLLHFEELAQPLAGVPSLVPAVVLSALALVCIAIFFRRVKGVEVVGE